MERLTEKVFGFVQLKACGNDFCKETCAEHDEEKSCKNCHIQKAFEKLAEYEDLDEQGLLLRFPCKNWMDIVFGEQETFFGIDESYIENPIREITVDSADRFTWYDGWKTLVLKGTDENGLDWEFSPEDIGKTVFLTKSEAEQKLKEMESD